MSFDYSVNGYPLTDPAGRWWVTADGTSHSSGVAMRSVQNQVPGMHGIPDVGREFREPGSLNLRVMVRSRDTAVRELCWEAVKALFTGGETFELGRAVAGVSRVTVAKLKSISEPELSPKFGTLVGVIGVTILDGLFHGLARDSTFSLASPVVSAVVAGVDGTAATDDWVLRVRGPLTSFTAVDDVTQTGINWGGALTASQYLFVSGVSARISADAGAWVSGGTEASGGISKPSRGLLALTPRPTTDVLTRRATWSVSRAGASAASEITIRARGAYA